MPIWQIAKKSLSFEVLFEKRLFIVLFLLFVARHDFIEH